MNHIEELRNNPYVKERDLGNGVSSFNFSKKAFWDKHWDEQTIRARGLFVDTNTGDVVARSYNKFFNWGECTETQPQHLKKNLTYPVAAYRKENGFLGIMSGHDGKLFVASKSTNQGDFAGYFQDILDTYLAPSQQDDLANFLEIEGISLVFEVIDPEQDPHIVEYSQPQLILLDAIYNSFDYRKLSYDYLVMLSCTFLGCNYKQQEGLFFSWEEIEAFLIKHQEDQIEGWVFEDADGFMFKYKTPYYKRWKSLRRVLQQYCGSNKALSEIKGIQEVLSEFDYYNLKKVLDYYRTKNYIPSVIEARKRYYAYRCGEIS